MSTTLEAVRPIELSEIREARKRIEKTIVRTPLVCLELGAGFPDIRLKLENLQPINAYKLRGAANAVAMLPESERRRGVWTISAGHGGDHRQYRRRRFDHGRRQYDQGAQTGNKGLGRRTGDGCTRCAVVQNGIAAGIQGLESVVRRRRWWPKHVPSHVGANEIASGQLHRRQPGRNERRDAPHGGKGANYFRRRRRAASRGGANRKSRQRSDRGHCLRRQYRHAKIL